MKTITLTKKEVEEAREDFAQGKGSILNSCFLDYAKCQDEDGFPALTPLCHLCKKLTQFAKEGDMRLETTLEIIRNHLKSIERERRRAHKERDRWIGKNDMFEGWERGRDMGLYSGKIRVGYIYRALRELEGRGEK